MRMDQSLRGYTGSGNGVVHLGKKPLSVISSHNNIMAETRFNNHNHSVFLDHSHRGFHYPQPDLTPTTENSISSLTHDVNSPEDCDFSDTVLKYISQMLMEEEDHEDKTSIVEESSDLRAAEKSFYEVLGKKYPPSPEQSHVFQNGESPDENFTAKSNNYVHSSCYSNEYLVDNNTLYQNLDNYTSQLHCLPDFGVSHSSYSSSNSAISSLDGLLDSPSSIVIQAPDHHLCSENRSMWQFRKGVEEASRFLPTQNDLVGNVEANELLALVPSKFATAEVSVKSEKKNESSPGGSRGRKNPCSDVEDLEEGRSSKQAAIYIESTLRSKMFDLVLLCSLGDGREHLTSFRQTLQSDLTKSMQQTGQIKGLNVGKGRGKRQGRKKEVVDLRSLLIQCAQAVAADDHRSANELLKQVRQHSSPFGDGSQRLASCFADGLEARLAGTGSQIYKGLINKRTSAADVLKAYRLYLAACPFRKISNFTSNRTILDTAAKATSVHVIDFGILYGFQWPTLIQRLSLREGGPPKLRITGIEFPQTGFRPAERVDETGRRLKAYAETFNVSFDYNAIAKKWETITLEELKIDRDELLIVNCLYRGKNLPDESVTAESARNRVLDLIKKIKPDLFIHGITNGAYNAPFFVTRFREALFHFSALFDILELIVPRWEPERMLIEKEIFGREALNVIACEGCERVERPETYKQWQIRIMRSGFVQQPISRYIMKRAAEKVKTTYHRDFVIDEDNGWLLQGWKGRIIFAISSWKPA
ncbi:scarecrow-like protein 9 [Humulus lupulus]|uniref:scarecrow-like protein 9 n=1 Tax=Humulus lupulus TaxID=3486 RepID=UPI002B403FD3|nr:scarecrow-like protein 9 [Humulus lupulus]